MEEVSKMLTHCSKVISYQQLHYLRPKKDNQYRCDSKSTENIYFTKP